LATKPKLKLKISESKHTIEMKRQMVTKKEQLATLTRMNKEFVRHGLFSDVEDLNGKLEQYKNKFMSFDLTSSGELDLMGLKQIMERLGTPKTHRELTKMIRQVDTTNSGTITYKEFLEMMLGSRTSVLKLTLQFEERGKKPEKPKGRPPPRSLEDLP